MHAFKDSTFTKEREEEREREDETEEMRSRIGALRDDYVSGFRAKISQCANAGQFRLRGQMRSRAEPSRDDCLTTFASSWHGSGQDLGFTRKTRQTLRARQSLFSLTVVNGFLFLRVYRFLNVRSRAKASRDDKLRLQGRLYGMTISDDYSVLL